MADDYLPRLPQQAEIAAENVVPPIEPEVRDIECVESTPVTVFSLARNLEDVTRFIKLVQQCLDPIQPLEFENAKLVVLSYLSLPHSVKLTDRRQSSFVEAIAILRRDPVLNAQKYDKLTFLGHRFPQLVNEFLKAKKEKENAKFCLWKFKRSMEQLKNLNDEAKNNTREYRKLETQIRNIDSKPEWTKTQLTCQSQFAINKYKQVELAFLRIQCAERDICRILNEVEELCSDISL